MSEVKVNKISPRSGTDVTLGDSGDTFTLPSGGTIAIASGATINNQGTAVNFGATGSASWVTTVKTATFTATAGEGYFCNTTAGVFTVNLPAGTAGAVVAVKDYAGTFDNNNLTIAANGSDKIGGSTDNVTMSTEGIAITLVFIDSTQGWLVTDSGLQSEASQYTAYDIDYLVVAGGGSGGYVIGGGAGAGGMLNGTLSSVASGTLTATVGGGGPGINSDGRGNNGDNSVLSGASISTLTSIGGGGGGRDGVSSGAGADGGSGGGAGGAAGAKAGGSGTSGQGNDGGSANTSAPNYGAGGGGGKGAVGGNGSNSAGGAGGNGTANSITGSSVTYAGGGGGNAYTSGGAAGGSGGGGAGTGIDATANTGGGGGGSNGPGFSGSGGSGIVIISMPDANYSGIVTGSPTVATGVSGKTVLTFNGGGTYVTG